MTMATGALRRAASRGYEHRFDAPLTGMVFLSGGTLAVGLGDGSVRLIVPDDKVVTASPHAAGSAVLALVADLDGNSVLTGGDDGRVARTTADGESSILAEFAARQIDVLAVSATAGLRAVAAGREVYLYDRTGRTIGTAGDHPSTVAGLAFNPKGKRLAVSHYGGVTLWWTGALGQPPARLQWPGSHIGIIWSPDGSTVLTAMQENDLHGWRVADGRHMRMEGYAAKVRSMAWLSKPMTLVTAGADSVIGWPFGGSGPMGKPAIEIGTGIGRLVTCVAVHPSQPCVAAGFEDGGVALCGRTADPAIRLREPDGARVDALAWSAVGSRLAAGTEDGTVSVFDASALG
jgi:WD40 repeat protein